MPAVRRLAAILAADVAGYSRLMGADEEGTHERLKGHLRELIEPKMAEHRGRIVKNTGDGFLAEFASVVDAVRCAVEMQRGMAERNAGILPEKRIEFRVGINLGDVIAETEDIFGDGVNVAARLEGLAEPGGICISRVVRDQVRDRLDYTFEDLGDQQVKNIARPVRVFRVCAAGASIKLPMTPALPLPDKPSIAVMPFQNMSGDPEQEYFADGMVEEIITALSRIRWLFVIARNSTFAYKGQAVDVKRVGRELGVCYVLEGSVRKAGSRVRITAQLIDAGTGAHLWADRFDGSIGKIFDFQDKVATSVAGMIEPALQAVETASSARRSTNDLTAYDFYLRAYAMYWSSPREMSHALGLAEEAIERDPKYGPALACASICCMRLIGDGTSKEPEADRRKGIAFARRALQATTDDPFTIANAALALSAVGEDIGAMMALVDRALALNPSFARGWHISGMLKWWAGDADAAIDRAEMARRLSPRARVSNLHTLIGGAHFVSRRFDAAVPHLLLAIQDAPDTPQGYRLLGACYAHMGRIDDAREVVGRLRVITRLVIPDLSQLRKPEHRELYLSGLRLAAGEET
jgi:adenylate cyclase